MKDIKSLTLQELEAEMEELGLPKFRARQIYAWLYRGAKGFDEMLDLPKTLREKLSKGCLITTAKVAKRLVSERDGTIKYVFRLPDGEFVEAVLMRYKHGHSMCISTQVGCRMGCKFCATGQGGFFRNLVPSEMIAQVQAVQELEGVRVANVVLMGMGEPLDNYDNVLKFLHLATNPAGLFLGMRHFSLSTCGIIGKIDQLAQEKLQLTLSISLHAPNDTIRDEIMPINRKWPVDKLLAACQRYIQSTLRRISFEYAMIAGLNDTDDCAKELAGKLRGMLCHVNLIPINDTGGPFQKSSHERIARFSAILSGKGINVTVRRTLGSDISASCGQLRGQASAT